MPLPRQAVRAARWNAARAGRGECFDKEALMQDAEAGSSRGRTRRASGAAYGISTEALHRLALRFPALVVQNDPPSMPRQQAILRPQIENDTS
jgi:hypothetical protein